MKILVVDDDIDFADSMAEMLDLFGHEAITAYSFTDALAAGDRAVYDIALVDVSLGKQDGAECARRLCENAVTGKCVLMSGYGPGTLEQMGFDVRNFLFLRKPVKPDELLTLLKD